MSVDTPAHITILGAGPIGLETALYARYLGYDVSVYDAGDVCENLRNRGHLKMYSPFGQIRSPLGLAALKAQDENWNVPSDDEFLTGSELYERYYKPLSQSDLLVDFIQEGIRAQEAGREWVHKMELPDSDDRAASDFRIYLSNVEERQERLVQSDVLIDASGYYGFSWWLGSLGTGGLPAKGERCRKSSFELFSPDILGEKREHYANRHTLLVGSGCSAATTAIALAELHQSAPQTKVTWITRRELSSEFPGPTRRIVGGRLPKRDSLVEQANRLVIDRHPAFDHLPGTTIEEFQSDVNSDSVNVTLAGKHQGTVTVERIIGNIGLRPDLSMVRELQVQYCYATEAPEGIGRILRANPLPNDVGPEAFGPADLITKEPDFYILGAKSFGRDPRFTIAHGLRQIRDLFTIIGDRENLDLYATAASTMPQ